MRWLREQAKKRVWFAIEYAKDNKGFTNPDIHQLDELTKAEKTALKKSVTPDKDGLWIDFEL